MMEKYKPYTRIISTAITNKLAHGLTITATATTIKLCGGTLVCFASVLFNLEHGQVSAIVMYMYGFSSLSIGTTQTNTFTL